MDRPRGARSRTAGRSNTRKATFSPNSSATASPRHSSSFTEPNEPSLDSPAPVVSKTPQTVPAGRRGGKGISLIQPHSLFTPATNASAMSLRKRSRTTDTSYDGAADEDESNQKGGHSLRKRTRVDYSFDATLEEEAAANITSAPKNTTLPTTRGTRKRKADLDDDPEDLRAGSTKRRLTERAQSIDSPSGRRKNPVRRSTTDTKSYVQDMDDNEVRDTIEVGVSYDDMNESDAISGSGNSFSSSATQSSPVAKAEQHAEQAENDHLPQNLPLAEGDSHNGIESQQHFFNGPVAAGSSQSTQEPRVVPEHRPIRIKLISHRAPPEPVQQPGDVLDEQEEISESPSTEVEQPQLSEASSAAESPAPSEQVIDGRLVDELQDLQPITQTAPPGEIVASPEQILSLDEEEPQPLELAEPIQPETERTPPVAPPAEPEPHETPEEVQAVEQPLPEAEEADVAADVAADEVETRTITGDEQQDNEVAPDEASVAQVEDEEEPADDLPPGAHLTTYVPGEYVWHPESLPGLVATDYQEDEDAEADEDGLKEDIDEDKDGSVNGAAEGDAIDMPDIEIDDVDKDVVEADEETQEQDDRELRIGSEAITPLPVPSLRGSPDAESAQPTRASSADLAEEADVADDADDDTPVSAEPVSKARFYKFPKLTDVSVYADLLKNHSELSKDELFLLCAKVNECLSTMTDEYNSCGRIIDDHQNAERRRAFDADYERRTANLDKLANADAYIERDFQVRGYKARQKRDMSEAAWLKSQDKLQAAVYGFEYDPHPSKIGNQEPDLQRVGVVTRRMLRNQPRQTARAAEAEQEGTNTTVLGKRMRKPRELFDGTQDISRSATPVPAKGGRRGRRKADAEGDTTQQPAESTNPSPARKGRGGRKRAANASENATPSPSQAGDAASVQGVDDAPAPRANGNKRGPRAARVQELYREDLEDTSAPATEAEDQPPVKRRRTKKQNPQNPVLQIPAANSFSNEPSSAATDGSDEARPSTSSSSNTTTTTESAYSFRPKRRSKFKALEEGVDDNDTARPPRKRARRGAKNQTQPREEAPVMELPRWHQSPPNYDEVDEDGNARPKKIVMIKVAGLVGRAKTSTPSNLNPFAAPPAPASHGSQHGSQPGGVEEGEKDYSQMTKSEKMSHSMKST
jgi:hypothetical protein